MLISLRIKESILDWFNTPNQTGFFIISILIDLFFYLLMIFQIVAEIHNIIIKVISSFIIYFCYPNTKQLAFDLESGIATISRDLDYMSDRMYAPIEYDFFYE